MPPPLLVSNLTNIRYLTGVSMTAGVLLLRGRKRMLFVDDRYTEKARKEVARGVRVHHIDTLEEYVKRYKRVRFEAEDVTVGRLKRWKKQFRGTRLIPSEGVIEEMRRRKRPEELTAIAKACRMTDLALKAVPYLLNVGAPRRGAQDKKSLPQRLEVALLALGAPAARPYQRNDCLTERQLAWLIEKLARDLGADAMAFETIVAFGSHTSQPHHRPTNRKLRKGDIVQIDMGVKVDGYCSDCSRVFFTREPTKEQRQIHHLLVKIVRGCTQRAKAGTRTPTLDQHARKLMRNEERRTKNEERPSRPQKGAETYDTFFLHSLGHGVGLDIHEGVNLSSRKGAPRTKLLANEVITIEPGIYLVGKWGMRIEDTILVTRTGGKRLTQEPYRAILSKS